MGWTKRDDKPIENIPEVVIKNLGSDFNMVKQDGYIPFTPEHYKRLEEAIKNYKETNSKESKSFILSMFNDYINKYAKFINYGWIRYYDHPKGDGTPGSKIDPAIWRFVCLYSQDKSKSKFEQFFDTCWLIKELFSKLDFDDIYNSLVIALFKMVNSYKILKPGDEFFKENGSFHTYVDRAFHWAAYKELNIFIKDPLNSYSNLSYDANDNGLIDIDSEIEFNMAIERVNRNNMIDSSSRLILKEPKGITPYDTDSLNFNWINGITCSDVFSILTQYERELLILLYVKHMTIPQAAEALGYNKATISVHKRKIINKLKNELGIEKGTKCRRDKKGII